MNELFSILASHLLTIIEYEIQKNEPELIDMVTNEIELLISKLETYIQTKNAPVTAPIVAPQTLTSPGQMLLNTQV